MWVCASPRARHKGEVILLVMHNCRVIVCIFERMWMWRILNYTRSWAVFSSYIFSRLLRRVENISHFLSYSIFSLFHSLSFYIYILCMSRLIGGFVGCCGGREWNKFKYFVVAGGCVVILLRSFFNSFNSSISCSVLWNVKRTIESRTNYLTQMSILIRRSWRRSHFPDRVF